MKKCDCENDFEIAEDWRKNNQDCSMVLDSRVKGKECWPIRKHVLCLKCNRRRQDESFLYFNFIVEKNFRQDESEPEESDAEEWTHHSRGVKQQVWDDIIAFHNYLFNKLDPNPDFEIPKSKSDFFTKKANKNWQRWTKKFEPFENNNNHHELLQVPFKCRHLGFELTCLST